MSDDDSELVCAFCNKDSDLDMQVLPNGQPIMLCNSCAAGMQAAAEIAQKQFDAINQSNSQREIQTRFLLTIGTILISVGASFTFFHHSFFAMIMFFGSGLYLWGWVQRGSS